MNRPGKNLSTGFTLVEILIALLIFSIVISTLFSSFNAFISSSDAIKKSVNNTEKIRIVFRRISMDLEGLYVVQPPRYKKPEFDSDPDPYRFIGIKITVGQEIFSSMVFTSLAHVKLGAAQHDGVARIAYYLKENEAGTYDLYRSDILSPFPDNLETCNDPVLVKNISGFELVYKDKNNDDYQTWDSDSKEFQHTFPVSIDIKLTCGSGEDRRISEFSIDINTGRESID